MIPANSYVIPVDADVATVAASLPWVVLNLTPGQALVPNPAEQKGAFFVWSVPRYWHECMACPTRSQDDLLNDRTLPGPGYVL